MKELRGKTVLVTGAASGIGRETALAFAREGAVPLLADIDAGGLEEVSRTLALMGAESRDYLLDVSKPGDVDEVASRIHDEFGGLDVLVNNAGVFIWADFMDTTPEDWDWLLGVNLWGPINTLRAFLPRMIERKTGHVVNVASAGGLYTLPALSAYCTSKFAVVGMTEALSQEVRGHGIAVTTICPGSTKTPIIKNIRVRGLDREKLENRIFPIANRYPAEKAAARIVDAVKRERPFVLMTATMWVLYLVKRASPALFRGLMRPFTRLFYSRLRP